MDREAPVAEVAAKDLIKDSLLGACAGQRKAEGAMHPGLLKLGERGEAVRCLGERAGRNLKARLPQARG
jgi:hypothetical protein